VNQQEFEDKYFQPEKLLPCQNCGEKNYLRLKTRFRCRECFRERSLFTDTILEKNHVSIDNWLKTVKRYSEKELSARSLSQLDEIRYPTALRILKTIRTSNQQWAENQILRGDVEVDEVFLGFNHAHGRAAHPIIVLLCEKGGEKRVLAVQAEDSKSATLLKIIQNHIQPGSHIITDAHKGYSKLSSLGYQHTVHNVQASNHPAHKFLPLVHSQANSLRVFFKTFVKPPQDNQLIYYLSEFSWRQSHISDKAKDKEAQLLDSLMERNRR
jgi:transposase-like protein